MKLLTTENNPPSVFCCMALSKLNRWSQFAISGTQSNRKRFRKIMIIIEFSTIMHICVYVLLRSVFWGPSRENYVIDKDSEIFFISKKPFVVRHAILVGGQQEEIESDALNFRAWGRVCALVDVREKSGKQLD